ncbi:MAG: translation initiation factor IF-2 associated domain-containing protein, partial [Immundisolibacteraceae bacterium]|nr:translation initiation factor IF-2 associated domain-containing protein [Immundisolibacteraceae bacterium]
MKTVTVADFAESVNISVDKLMLQLVEAGVEADSPETEITAEQKTQLLVFLRKSHGADDEDGGARPKRVTLRRNVTSELRQSSGPKGRSSISAPGADKVTVTVRKKRTFVKRAESPEPVEIPAELEEQSAGVASESEQPADSSAVAETKAVVAGAEQLVEETSVEPTQVVDEHSSPNEAALKTAVEPDKKPDQTSAQTADVKKAKPAAATVA